MVMVISMQRTFIALEMVRMRMEKPTFITSCADGEDNDEDGFIDGNDPDCAFIAVENSIHPRWH